MTDDEAARIDAAVIDAAVRKTLELVGAAGPLSSETVARAAIDYYRAGVRKAIG